MNVANSCPKITLKTAKQYICIGTITVNNLSSTAVGIELLSILHGGQDSTLVSTLHDGQNGTLFYDSFYAWFYCALFLSLFRLATNWRGIWHPSTTFGFTHKSYDLSGWINRVPCQFLASHEIFDLSVRINQLPRNEILWITLHNEKSLQKNLENYEWF